MDVAALRTSEAIARHGSMNRAAAELDTVQSNVTSRNLKHGMGATRSRRYAKGVALGRRERMLSYAEHLVRLLPGTPDSRT